MKKHPVQQDSNPLHIEEIVAPEKPPAIVFHLPPGSALSDIYMDGQQVSQELNLSKRTLREYRRLGKLSYTYFFGKIFYFKQEIAAMLAEATKHKKGHLPFKN